MNRESRYLRKRRGWWDSGNRPTWPSPLRQRRALTDLVRRSGSSSPCWISVTEALRPHFSSGLATATQSSRTGLQRSVRRGRRITDRLCLLVGDKLDAAQRSQVEGDHTLGLAIRRRLSGEPLYWGPLGPQHRSVDLPRPPGGAIDLARGEFVGVISAEVEAVVDGLFDTTRQAGVRPNDIAEVYLAGGLASSDLVAAMVAQRLGRVPICVPGGNKVALGAANAALGTATQPPLEGDRHRAVCLGSTHRVA